VSHLELTNEVGLQPCQQTISKDENTSLCWATDKWKENENFENKYYDCLCPWKGAV